MTTTDMFSRCIDDAIRVTELVSSHKLSVDEAIASIELSRGLQPGANTVWSNVTRGLGIIGNDSRERFRDLIRKNEIGNFLIKIFPEQATLISHKLGQILKPGLLYAIDLHQARNERINICATGHVKSLKISSLRRSFARYTKASPDAEFLNLYPVQFPEHVDILVQQSLRQANFQNTESSREAWCVEDGISSLSFSSFLTIIEKTLRPYRVVHNGSLHITSNRLEANKDD